MIDKIDISGFRSFKNFSSDGLALVNLISGKNNSGKTNLLDAIESAYVNADQRVALLSSGQPAVVSNVTYIAACALSRDLAVDYSDAVELKRDAGVREFVRELEPSIKNLYVRAVPGAAVLMCDAGQIGRVPIDQLGHGFVRAFSIALCAAICSDSVLLVDEIENGMHFTIMHKFWTWLFKLAGESKCQIFATTQSAECIEGAVDAAQKLKLKDADFSYYRLRRRGRKSEAVLYPLDRLSDDTLMNWELR